MPVRKKSAYVLSFGISITEMLRGSRSPTVLITRPRTRTGDLHLLPPGKIAEVVTVAVNAPTGSQFTGTKQPLANRRVPTLLVAVNASGPATRLAVTMTVPVTRLQRGPNEQAMKKRFSE